MRTKMHFLLVTIAAGACLLGTATAQVDVASLKASAEAGSTEATLNREIVLNDLPTKSAAEASIPGRFSSMRPQSGLSDTEYAAAKLRAAKMTTAAAASSNLKAPTIVRSAANSPSASAAFQG